MVSDMVSRFFRDTLDEAHLGGARLAAAHWQDLAALGLLAVSLPERAGGLGGSARDAALMAEEFGRSLAITPLAESVVGAGGLIAHHGHQEQIERWVAPLLDGRHHLAWAPGRVAAEPDGSLTGELPLVRWATQAAALVVPVGDVGYVVPTGTPGMLMRHYELVDGTPVATVTLQSVQASRIALPNGAAGQSNAEAQLCYVAEMVGAMALLHRQTADYSQQRRQFGNAIGSFQVVQHKLARMFVWLEQARSSLLRAALCEPEDPGFVQAVAGAKAYVADAAQRLAEETVQLHGGIGITDELVVGRGLRRVAVLAQLFGNAESARAQLIA